MQLTFLSCNVNCSNFRRTCQRILNSLAMQFEKKKMYSFHVALAVLHLAVPQRIISSKNSHHHANAKSQIQQQQCHRNWMVTTSATSNSCFTSITTKNKYFNILSGLQSNHFNNVLFSKIEVYKVLLCFTICEISHNCELVDALIEIWRKKESWEPNFITDQVTHDLLTHNGMNQERK